MRPGEMLTASQKKLPLLAALGVLGLAALAAPSAASAAETVYTHTVPTGTIGGYEVKQDIKIRHPQAARRRLRHEDGDRHRRRDHGEPVPISRLMLHHIVFLNLLKPDNTCARLPRLRHPHRLRPARRSASTPPARSAPSSRCRPATATADGRRRLLGHDLHGDEPPRACPTTRSSSTRSRSRPTRRRSRSSPTGSTSTTAAPTRSTTCRAPRRRARRANATRDYVDPGGRADRRRRRPRPRRRPRARRSPSPTAATARSRSRSRPGASPTTPSTTCGRSCTSRARST